MSEMTDAELREFVASQEWYHTIELRPGVVTPGWFDTRLVSAKLPWPSLVGKRCLDVGTFDGFWALEMERKSAAEVRAIDVLDPKQWDWPAIHAADVVEAIGERKRAGGGFELVVEELKSKVQRMELSVYDLDPSVMGLFDFAYVGSLLLHLRDPISALMRVREVLEPGGQLILVDAIDWELTLRHPRSPTARLDGDGRPWWWRPNRMGLQRMVESAGFQVVDGPHVFAMPRGPGRARVRPSLRALKGAIARQEAIEGSIGDPHAWLVAVTPH